MKEMVWSGDGRFDSMGHSAKYGAYAMFCSTIMKVVNFELLQVRKNIHHVPPKALPNLTHEENFDCSQ